MVDYRANKEVIVVEDDVNDYTLIDHALREKGFPCRLRRVDTAEELEEELLRLAPDLVVCDHASAKWNSFAVLERVRAFQSNMPFVVVSGFLDERTEAALLQHGADGCVGKHHLEDLAPTAEQAIRQQAEDQARRVEEIRRSLPPLPLPRRRLRCA